jgi:hypothetical protein
MGREIRLPKNQVAIVDDEDFDHLNQFYWRVKWNPYTKSFYAYRRIDHGKSGTEHISMEREILGLEEGDGLTADHVRSGETLNNQRSNLRVATRSQNGINARLRSDSSSGYKGVNWNSAMKRYGARIQIRGKRIWILWTHDKVEAARAYDRAAIEHHGEFAMLNFPREEYVNG